MIAAVVHFSEATLMTFGDELIFHTIHKGIHVHA